MDLAIRVGWFADSSLRAKQIGSFRKLMVRSPQLAERLAQVRDSTELPALPFVANSALPERWEWARSEAMWRFGAVVAIDAGEEAR